jgi:stage II sporulation protein D
MISHFVKRGCCVRRGVWPYAPTTFWTIAFVGVVIAVTICLHAASAGHAFAGDVSGSLDDEVGLLYSPQLQFGADGTPQVTVGLMEKQHEVRVTSADGLELSGQLEEQGQLENRTVVTKPGEILRFEVISAKKALVAYWCGVENIPFGGADGLEKALATWRARSDTVQVFELGSVFGIQGHVIDNRTYILGIEAFESEAAATEAAQRAYQKYGTKTFVHPQLLRRPAGNIRTAVRRGTRSLTFVDLVKIKSRGKRPVKIFRVEHGIGYRWHGFEDRLYTGTILITLDLEGTLVAVNRIAVDRLLMGLVPAEIFPSAPLEALKAQSVVARGELLAKIGSRHILEPYRLCAHTHCQVYAGVKAENKRTSWAVRATRGEFLFRGADLVDSVYSAMCGGHTEDNDLVWEHPANPALRGTFDMAPEDAARWKLDADHLHEWLAASPPAYCESSSFSRKNLFRWVRRISAEEIDAMVAKVKPIGNVRSIHVVSRGVSGRVQVVRIEGTSGELIVQREWPVRQLFGNLRSGMFEVTVETDAQQMPVAFVFRGGGFGHGVGMCQIGAIGMAEQGFKYREILAHYYSGSQVFRLYGGADVPVEEPGVARGSAAGTPITAD